MHVQMVGHALLLAWMCILQAETSELKTLMIFHDVIFSPIISNQEMFHLHSNSTCFSNGPFHHGPKINIVDTWPVWNH